MLIRVKKRESFRVFVQDRIKTGKIHLLALVKKHNVLTWKTSAKVIKVRAKDTIIKLKEGRNLFARLAMVCKICPEIHIQEDVGFYEFTVVPRSLWYLFALLLQECPYAYCREGRWP